jgi:hypothetical protein
MSAIPFITSDGGKYTVHAEAVDFLSNLSGPISVVSIAGPYRTGKSTFLNRVLLDAPPGSGFGVGGSVNACTKGIWVYNRAYQFEGEHGPLQVVVVDSEGIGSLDADQNHDCQIFSLLLLLSSLFVYNSVGCIDEPSLGMLSLVSNVSQRIRLQSGSTATSAELSTVFPAFCWVIRDFMLSLENTAGQAITADQYLEQSIAGACPTRNTIRACFAERTCLTMPRLDDAAFAGECTRVRTTLFRRLHPMSYGGTTINGSMLATLARSYTDSINSGAAPVIEDSWSLVARMHATAERARALEEYRAFLVTWLDAEATNLADCLQRLLETRRGILRRFRHDALRPSDEVVHELAVELDDVAVRTVRARAEASQVASDDLANVLCSSEPAPQEAGRALGRAAAVRGWIDHSVRQAVLVPVACAWLATRAEADAGRRSELAACRSELEVLRATADREQLLEARVAQAAAVEEGLRVSLAESVESCEELRGLQLGLEAQVADINTVRLEHQDTLQQLDVMEQSRVEQEARLDAQRLEFAGQMGAIQQTAFERVSELEQRASDAEQLAADTGERLAALGTLHAESEAQLEACRVRHEAELAEVHGSRGALESELRETLRERGALLDRAVEEAAALQSEVSRLTTEGERQHREHEATRHDAESYKRKVDDLQLKEGARKRLKTELHHARADSVKYQHLSEWLEKDKQSRDKKSHEMNHELVVVKQKLVDAEHRYDMEILRLKLNQPTAHSDTRRTF